jgi:tagaturonate epimerase
MRSKLLDYMNTATLAPALPEDEAQAMAAELNQLSGLQVYARSITAAQRALFFLGKQEENKYLGILSAAGDLPVKFAGQVKLVSLDGTQHALTLASTTAAENAAALRSVLPFLVPRTLGLQKSAGCGDRLGLATPGHIRAIRQSDMAPIFAQQSMRENARTGRTPQQVMDDALWGVFQEGWRDGFGADADHLKTKADIDLCAVAGYTFYTIDPGDHVDNQANTASAEAVREKVEALNWVELESNPSDLQRRLADRSIDLGVFNLTIGQEEVLRAAAKYGRVVAHTVGMYRHLVDVMKTRPFELEMSVDETETVTSLAEHVYIAQELKRLGVRWVSLAPRYVGSFEKGVDYIGSLAEFEQSFTRHLAVARTFGPYKLSLHSGSDKFSIYPIVAGLAGELVHLKTAGTSYLEAVRAIAALNPTLFREIAAYARERYPVDRATYHVSAEIARMPEISSWPDERLTELPDDFHARQALHVTFGAVLNHTSFRNSLFATLRRSEETHYQMLEEHFKKHLIPFKSQVLASSLRGGE